jgi:hypothetical protein
MCDNPDPCKDAEDCDECNDMDAGEDDKACVWNGSTCLKKEADEKPKAMCAKPDLCESFTTCDSCKLGNPNEAGKACIWHTGKCFEVNEEERPDDMCVETDENDGFSFMPTVSFVLFFIMAAYCYYQRKARVGVSHIGDLSNRRFHKSAVYEGV